MKAVFFSAVAMAVSALAAPLVGNPVGNPVETVQNTVSDYKHITEMAPVSVPDIPAGVPGIEKRTISTSVELIADLNVAISAVVDVCVSIDGLVGQVSAGELSPDDCAEQAAPLLNKILEITTGLVGNISLGVDIDISVAAHLQIIVDLVVKLFATILVSLRGLVVAVGLRVEIKVIISSICGLLGNLLSLICGLIGDIVTILTGAISPLLVDISVSVLGSVLGTVLTPVHGVLVGLNLDISL